MHMHFTLRTSGGGAACTATTVSLVVARLPDGTWSPSSGFLVHTLGATMTWTRPS